MRSACLFLLLCTIAVPTGAGAQDRDPVAELTALGESLLYARYEEAVAAAHALLERDDLRAQERNQALEAKAIAELALGLDSAATATLSELYARDPGHRLADEDASPTIRAAFARVRESHPDTVPVRLHHQSPGTLVSRESSVVTVEIVAGADAVAELRLAYRYGGDTRFDTTLMRLVDARTAQGRIPLLTEREGAYAVEYFVEALAPSRTPLARVGSRQEPFRLVVPEEAPAAAPLHTPASAPGPSPSPSDEGGSVLGAWWLWTAVAVLVAGGVATWVLLGPPSEGPREGTLGTATLSLRWGR